MTGKQICDPTVKRADFRWQYAMAVFALLAVLLASLPAMAQQTRAEELAMKQAEKAKQLHPYEPNKAEKILLRLESKGFLGGEPEGFFPAFGSAYRTGSFAAGARYFNRFGDGGVFGIVGLWSIKNYKLAEAGFLAPRFLDDKVQIGATAQYLDAPKLPFYGIGQDSLKDDKTDYEYSPVTFGANATITPVKWFYFGGGADYLDITTKEGDIPNIFPPPVVPGLGLDPTYIRSHVFAAIDWRQSPGYSTSGGWYRADWYDYDQTNEGNFSFRQLDVQAIQLFPILRANWIIAVRALASLTYVDDGNQIPFFLLPNLGGGRDLRGYPDFRFMDNNRILWTVEYRWTPSKFMDMVIFYEAGKVTAERDDLDFDGLVNSYGIGARFHGPMSTPLRIEFAHSDEYNRIIFAFNPAW